MNNLTLKDAVHHGAEAVLFIGIGGLAFSSFSIAATSYGLSKVTYLGVKMLLQTCAPGLSKDTNRSISFVASLIAGGSTLQVLQEKVTGEAVNVLVTSAKLLVVTTVSLGGRHICDKTLKSYRRRVERDE